ncbi:MAG: polymer-forming cytoskeletal protein [Gemmatimonadaceae bacterium]|nr:polymer-forming cytoskeletal protein [Gemmatimonadaceae bacterium]MDQ3519913.1 polymer-forming cytoskeletal protein [Gemmatimonadota bacterium]
MNLSLKRRSTPSIGHITSRGDNYSVLDAKLTIVGDIETDGTVRIDGRLEGSVRRAAVVILGAGATIKGNVTAREVVLSGSVQGNIEAADRVELQATAVVTGDIEAGAILIHEGGAVRGRLSVRSIDPKQQQDGKGVRAPSLTPKAMRIPVPAMAGEAK